ncbi:MAG: hypothetical protein H6Q90_1218 [Deltaproteobacteria bacterium]|nr:hypothetical protein [Deltaproteobacteria bacterium]
MARSYVGYVLKRGGRWRADLPGAMALLFAIMFVAGLKPDLRHELGVFVYGSLGAALVFGYLWWLGHRSLRWNLTADATGVRLVDRAGKTVDLGIPKAIGHGRYAMLLTGGPARRLTPHIWVSIETRDGRTFVFQRAMGALEHVPKHWPEATSPRTSDVYSSLGFDPVAFHDAIAVTA